MRPYEANNIPGLFQTEDYAQALLQWGIESNSEALLRMQRQDLITQ